MTDTVVFIHGLWLNGTEMGLMRRWFTRGYDFPTRQFSYRTTSRGLSENIALLREFIAQLPAERVHLVGYSLGGVLALQTLRQFPTGNIGRVVCLGSPLLDCTSARNLSRSRRGKKIIGQTFSEAVLQEPLQSHDGACEVGVIAGTIGIGLGLMVGRLEKPHDGVVTVKETELPGINDHLMLPVSHSGLLLSRRVVKQAAFFLGHGRFDK